MDGITEFDYHEVLDRLSLIQGMINDYVIDHPATKAHPFLREMIDDADQILYRAYQFVGALRFPEGV